MHQWAGVLQNQTQISHRNAWKLPIQTLVLRIAISQHALLRLDFCDKSFLFVSCKSDIYVLSSREVKWLNKSETNSNTWNWNIVLIWLYYLYKWNIFFILPCAREVLFRIRATKNLEVRQNFIERCSMISLKYYLLFMFIRGCVFHFHCMPLCHTWAFWNIHRFPQYRYKTNLAIVQNNVSISKCSSMPEWHMWKLLLQSMVITFLE